MRVLVIEDNPANLQLMSYLLRAHGHTVAAATDGEAGLLAVRASPPDLVVCDLQLPGIDGYEVARRLGEEPTEGRIPLVAVTAFAMVGDRERVLRAGFDGYISKPIRPETFASEVEACARTRAGRPGEPPAPGARAAPLARSAPGPVLVVDNSPVNRNLLRSILEPWGHSVRCASGGAEALALAHEELPALILSDIHMPGQDGFDFIRAVKADPFLAHVPFVFLTSTVWDRLDEDQGLALGADAFIRRPIATEDLLARLRCWLQPGEQG